MKQFRDMGHLAPWSLVLFILSVAFSCSETKFIHDAASTASNLPNELVNNQPTHSQPRTDGLRLVKTEDSNFLDSTNTSSEEIDDDDYNPFNLTETTISTGEPMEQLNATMASTLTTTSTTMPTIAELFPKEEKLQPQSILDDTKEKIEAMQLFLYKHKTRLSLNLLDSSIPLLQSIQRNMSILLHTSNQSLASFVKSDNQLENQLISLKNQVEEKRFEIQKYSSVYSNAEEQLDVVQKTLTNILLPHVITSTDIASKFRDSASNIAELTNSEIKTNLEKILLSNSKGRSNSKNKEDALFSYLSSIQTSANRVMAYSNALAVLQNTTLDKCGTLYLRLAYKIYQEPDLSPLKPDLDEQVLKLFNNEDKGIAHASYGYLVVTSGFAYLSTYHTSGPSNRFWRFYPVEDGQYFVIAYVGNRKSIQPIVTSLRLTDTKLTSAVASNNHRYHWKVKLLRHSMGLTYLKFMARNGDYELAFISGHAGLFKPQNVESHYWTLD